MTRRDGGSMGGQRERPECVVSFRRGTMNRVPLASRQCARGGPCGMEYWQSQWHTIRSTWIENSPPHDGHDRSQLAGTRRRVASAISEQPPVRSLGRIGCGETIYPVTPVKGIFAFQPQEIPGTNVYYARFSVRADNSLMPAREKASQNRSVTIPVIYIRRNPSR